MSIAKQIEIRAFPHGQFSRALAERMAGELDGTLVWSTNWIDPCPSPSPTDTWAFDDGSKLVISHTECRELVPQSQCA
jgi:hypothetical protein